MTEDDFEAMWRRAAEEAEAESVELWLDDDELDGLDPDEALEQLRQEPDEPLGSPWRAAA